MVDSYADSYAVPLCYAIGSVLIFLVVCLICHRRLRRRARGVSIDELPQRVVDDRLHCYHHHDLLHHHQDHSHSFNEYQLEQPSPPSESDGEIEPEHSGDQETSSPDSV